MKESEIYIDGASKGNPGPSGIGVIICQDGQTIRNISSFIGNATNNIAEYTALVYALQESLILKAESIKINTDSQLLYRQINRVYKIKNPNLLGLYNQAMRLFSAFKQVKINHIYRQDNRGADRLANKAIKEAVKKRVL
jgi:ribonuclease HI